MPAEEDRAGVANRGQQVLSKPYDLGGQQVCTSASGGIALSSPDYQSPEEFLRDAEGTWMRIFDNTHNDRPGLVRNGESVDWDQQLDLYRPLHKATAPISLGWQHGTLRVEAGGYTFEPTVTAEGKLSRSRP